MGHNERYGNTDGGDGIGLNITAMSFNLRVCRWLDLHQAWPFRKLSAAEAVSAQNPWLVGTQEGHIRMLEDLKQLLPAFDWVGEGRKGGSKGEHNAIFYHRKKLRLMEHGQFWLSETPDIPGSIGWDGRYPRICTWARFAIVKGRVPEVRVYNTHLDHMGHTARAEGASLIWSAILEHQERLGPSPVILCGDFNAGPEHSAIRFLSGEAELHGRRAELENAFADPSWAGRTFHGFRGGKTGAPIDYLFGGFGAMPMHGDVNRSKHGGRYPSDHYPVTAVFKLAEPDHSHEIP